MPKLLITGVSGLLGANLALAALDKELDVVGVYNQHPIVLEGGKVTRADLTDHDQVQRLLRMYEPDWIVNCAAMTDVDACERDPEAAFYANRDLPGMLAEAAASVGAKFAHLSTDAVFDGRQGGYRESDLPNPVNAYGRAKLAGEELTLERNPGTLVIRTNIFGWNAQDKQSLAEWFLYHLEQGKECNGFTDALVTPILATDLAEIILCALEGNLTGVLHLAGAQCISKYEFGCRLASEFDLDPDVIQPGTVQSGDLLAQRGRNLCLESGMAAEALGIKLPGLVEGIHRFHRQKLDGHLVRLKQMVAG